MVKYYFELEDKIKSCKDCQLRDGQSCSLNSDAKLSNKGRPRSCPLFNLDKRALNKFEWENRNREILRVLKHNGGA